MAGPVSIGIVLAPEGFDVKAALPDVADSKTLSPKKREAIYQRAVELRENGSISWGVFSESSRTVDTVGIAEAVRRAIERGLASLCPQADDVFIYLDGSLAAPPLYQQETIIRGDALIPVISLASVVAKVTRDRFMETEIAPKYPLYGFEEHKGYGSAAHIKAIQKYGPSAIHRKSFLSRILQGAA